MSKDIKEYLKYYLGQECQNSQGDIIYLSAGVLDNIFRYQQPVKPILRKLESMTEEERKEFEATRAFQKATPVHQIGLMVWTGESFHYLLSRGFDLFGLIDSGLALNKDDLK